MERLAKRLNQMKLILYGDGEKEVDKDKCTVSGPPCCSRGKDILILSLSYVFATCCVGRARSLPSTS